MRCALFVPVGSEADACELMAQIYGGDQSSSFTRLFSTSGSQPATHKGACAELDQDHIELLEGTVITVSTEPFWDAAAALGLILCEEN